MNPPKSQVLAALWLCCSLGPTVMAVLLFMDLAALGQIYYCHGHVPSSGRRKEVQLWQKALFGDIHCVHDISHTKVSHPLESGSAAFILEATCAAKSGGIYYPVRGRNQIGELAAQ